MFGGNEGNFRENNTVFQWMPNSRFNCGLCVLAALSHDVLDGKITVQ